MRYELALLVSKKTQSYMKPFEKWKFSEMERTFGLQRTENHPLMEQWMATTENLSAEDIAALTNLRRKLREEVDAWHEEELKAMFIVPVIETIEFRQRGQYTTFMDRALKSTLKDLQGNEIEMKGKVDLMVAGGQQDPQEPYFFLHEYKPSLPSGEPLGQLLAAMLVAQDKNTEDLPLYGAYVIGRHWFFVVLSGQTYAVSEDFSATGEDIFKIAIFLKARKRAIEQFFASKNS